ncbi:flavin monoamine oxidase family protein [Siccirubricoccus deserti]
MIGTVAGAAVMYEAMTSLGHAAQSTYRGPIRLEDARGASVLILGAGLTGLVAAIELRKAGYKVEVLEYQNRAGGRCWTIRGGDTYTELGGATQRCAFDRGLYFNPGPWRIPYNHSAILDYCRRYGVALEPFVQVNHNAWLHNTHAFGGKPQRFREVQADFIGHTSELLAKVARQDRLDGEVTRDDREALLAALQRWGALDRDYAYRESLLTSERRGFARDPGGGPDGAPKLAGPLDMRELMRSGLWRYLANGMLYEFQTTMFQPVGGMDMIAQALFHALGPEVVRFGRKVTEIGQSESGVTVAHVDARQGGEPLTSGADWCLCTIPLTVLSQTKMAVGPRMRAAIDAISYDASAKVGLQFRRRFWEEDEAIFGGVSYTDLPISQISYPSSGFLSGGKGVLLGAYPYGGVHAYELTALPPEERVRRAVEWGAQLHPRQYREEFETGISVGWHRVPWALGCAGHWTGALRDEHYADLCAMDGRLLLAGEHASHLPAWQEGAILSSLDAVSRLHRRVVEGDRHAAEPDPSRHDGCRRRR